MYYAAFYPYGIRTGDFNSIIQFKTRKERDDFVEGAQSLQESYGEIKTKAVTAKEIKGYENLICNKNCI